METVCHSDQVSLEFSGIKVALEMVKIQNQHIGIFPEIFRIIIPVIKYARGSNHW